eukprot:458698_1
MVDIRQEVCGVIVAGTPAPGINGVISAVVIKCLSLNIVPIGFLYGFRYLKQGITKYYQTLHFEDVTRVHNRGGSILYTSKQQIRTEDDVENCIRALQHVRVKYLITIGGTDTAFSAHKLAQGFRDRSLLLNTDTLHNNDHQGILITHVPKTIYNDLPLPDNCYTFGFSTAREIGSKVVADLSADAKSMNRWYIVTTIGAKSGHLTLGISTASAATLCLIPEEFEHKKRTVKQQTHHDKKRKEIQMTVKSLLDYEEFMESQDIPKEVIESLVDKEAPTDEKRNGDAMELQNNNGVEMKEYLDIIDATMIKRAAEGKFYGVAVIGEGLVDLLTPKDLNKFFDGNHNKGHELFGHVVKEELKKRWRTRKHEIHLRTKFVGFELRSADPNAQDMILSRELGYSAVLVCQMKQVNATIVTMKGGELVSIPLSEIVDQDTGRGTIKKLNTDSLSYKVSQTYMIRLHRSDLTNKTATRKYADMAGMDVNTFIQTYSYVAQ